MAAPKWCFSWLEPDRSSGKPRAVGLKDALWNQGDVITVSFLDGDAALKKRVRAAAEQWVGPAMANLQFSFTKKGGLIRISFELRGSWSTIGTTCNNVDPSKPTMNFGWLTSATAKEELERVVLHEFGHALGLIHEHQSPAKGIAWKRAAVIKDLSGPPHYWSEQQIETNIFKRFKKSQTNSTKLDRDSIMLYPIPARWTTNFSSKLNMSLSALDRKHIARLYPH